MGLVKVLKIQRSVLIRRTLSLVAVLALVFSLAGGIFDPTSAAAIDARKVTISNSAGAATAVEHDYSFDPPGAGTIGEIEFLYCTTATGGCTAPTGLTVTAFTLDAESLTGAWAKDAANTTANKAIIDIATPEAPPAGAVTVDLGTITNPTANNTTYFVRITTYTTNTGATPVDTGTVAFATVSAVTVSATVAETLTFALGASSVALGELSTGAVANQTLTSTVSTNAADGYISTIKDDGNLRDGGNDINDAAGGTIVAGTEEYGVGTSKTGQTIAEEADCANTPFNASGITSAAQQYASGTQVSSDGTTLCFQATIGATTPTGSYSHLVTLVTTPTF